MFQVTEEQLDALASKDYTLWASLSTGCFSVFLTALIGLMTLTVKTPTESAILVAVVITCGILGLAFGGLGFREWRNRSVALDDFKNRLKGRQL